MRIAILGATSQIARDLILSMGRTGQYDLVLFARRPNEVKNWLTTHNLEKHSQVLGFESFVPREHFDAVINFVGVGDPAKAAEMGASIFDITLQYDDIVLNYLHHYPYCRYLFLSSGAVYGSAFEQPVDQGSPALIPINGLKPQNWYGVAKLVAECRHRAMCDQAVLDLRIFSYFSRTQDISARFFISDMLRAIQSGETLATSSDNIVRDYLHPFDLHNLISLLLSADPVNDAIDCYSKAPVDKMALLNAMQNRFGLIYKTSEAHIGINATGIKLNYYSKYKKASMFNYKPTRTSLEGIMEEAAHILEN